MDEKKYNLVVWTWGILLIVLQFFTLLSNITMKTNFLITEEAKVIAIISSVVSLILLLSYLVLSLLQSKAGPIIGIICSVFYLLTLDVLSIVLGIGFLVSCVSMIKELNKLNN